MVILSLLAATNGVWQETLSVTEFSTLKPRWVSQTVKLIISFFWLCLIMFYSLLITQICTHVRRPKSAPHPPPTPMYLLKKWPPLPKDWGHPELQRANTFPSNQKWNGSSKRCCQKYPRYTTLFAVFHPQRLCSRLITVPYLLLRNSNLPRLYVHFISFYSKQP